LNSLLIRNKLEESEKTFIDDMSQPEAARYRRYWQREAPTQIVPGKYETTDKTKISTNSDEVYKRINYYDEYGRLKGQTHYSAHPVQQGYHPNPHHHRRHADWFPGDRRKEWEINPKTGSKVWAEEYPKEMR